MLHVLVLALLVLLQVGGEVEPEADDPGHAVVQVLGAHLGGLDVDFQHFSHSLSKSNWHAFVRLLSYKDGVRVARILKQCLCISGVQSAGLRIKMLKKEGLIVLSYSLKNTCK